MEAPSGRAASGLTDLASSGAGSGGRCFSGEATSSSRLIGGHILEVSDDFMRTLAVVGSPVSEAAAAAAAVLAGSSFSRSSSSTNLQDPLVSSAASQSSAADWAATAAAAELTAAAATADLTAVAAVAAGANAGHLASSPRSPPALPPGKGQAVTSRNLVLPFGLPDWSFDLDWMEPEAGTSVAAPPTPAPAPLLSRFRSSRSALSEHSAEPKRPQALPPMPCGTHTPRAMAAAGTRQAKPATVTKAATGNEGPQSLSRKRLVVKLKELEDSVALQTELQIPHGKTLSLVVGKEMLFDRHGTPRKMGNVIAIGFEDSDVLDEDAVEDCEDNEASPPAEVHVQSVGSRQEGRGGAVVLDRIPLPSGIDTDNAVAACEDGLLTITFARAQLEKARKVSRGGLGHGVPRQAAARSGLSVSWSSQLPTPLEEARSDVTSEGANMRRSQVTRHGARRGRPSTKLRL
eukprot:SM000071S21062  [mRNA]  locus=s71:227388:228919:+ [translate_table: standard]